VCESAHCTDWHDTVWRRKEFETAVSFRDGRLLAGLLNAPES
jgi:hypothetical protein